ncbi:MAG: ATP-binding protein [Candidatus Metalachnospira sp.]|nr:ATP-binding protein [Candidatus Metalachnospira sp.]
MTKRIFRSIIFVSLITFVSCFVLIMGILYEYFNNQLLSELKNEAVLVEQGVELYGEEYLEEIDIENRVTWIAEDGKVLYDNKYDAASLENHKNREEVKEALENGRGSSQRYSDTVAEKIVYYALRLDDGSIIRVSSAQYSAFALFLALTEPMIIVLIIVIAVSILFAGMLSKKIVKPINEMDLDNPDIDENYPEILPLIKKIRRQNSLIDNQMRDLKKNEEEFMTITSNMLEGFIIIDVKTDVLSYNSGALKLLEKDKAIIGKSVFMLDRSEALREAVSESLEGIHSERTLERDGKAFQILANPVFENDNVRGAVILIIDVTEKEQREVLRREFTSNVSHELKTPLTSIYGISEIMMNGIVRPEDIPKFSKDIHDETGRMIALVNDIIKLSRLDENASFGNKEPVDLFSSAKDVVIRLNEMSESNNVTVNLTGKSTVIEGVSSIVDEIVHNLCENAIKYNKPGGKVEIFVGTEDGRSILRVSDTGIGIAKENLSRVFERFYRVDKSHSKKIGGTGLGLSIVKHGAAYLGAEVKTESTVGKGTTITIIF